MLKTSMDTAIDSTSAICYPMCSDKILTTSALAFFLGQF